MSEALSIAEFCQRYGVGLTKAYNEINAGRLLARKSGRRTLILSTDAQRWATHLPLMPSKGAA